jgi:hypothetical protein
MHDARLSQRGNKQPPDRKKAQRANLACPPASSRFAAALKREDRTRRRRIRRAKVGYENFLSIEKD